MQYELKTNRVYWECGDGCCSDSWEEVELYCDGKCVLYTDVYYGLNSEYDSPQEILDWVNLNYPEYHLTLFNCEVNE